MGSRIQLFKFNRSQRASFWCMVGSNGLEHPKPHRLVLQWPADLSVYSLGGSWTWVEIVVWEQGCGASHSTPLLSCKKHEDWLHDTQSEAPSNRKREKQSLFGSTVGQCEGINKPRRKHRGLGKWPGQWGWGGHKARRVEAGLFIV